MSETMRPRRPSRPVSYWPDGTLHVPQVTSVYKESLQQAYAKHTEMDLDTPILNLGRKIGELLVGDEASVKSVARSFMVFMQIGPHSAKRTNQLADFIGSGEDAVAETVTIIPAQPTPQEPGYPSGPEAA